MAFLDGQGTVTTFNDGATAQTVGQVISYSFGDGEAPDIDVTNLASDAREFRPGLQDFGNLTLELQRDPANVGQAAMQAALAAGATREVTITIPSDAGDYVATFDAYVKSVPFANGVDAVGTGTANLKVTGAVVWTTP